MNKELLRVFSKEKVWRVQLWQKGLVKTSIMPPKKHPDYVGTEEVYCALQHIIYDVIYLTSCLIIFGYVP